MKLLSTSLNMYASLRNLKFQFLHLCYIAITNVRDIPVTIENYYAVRCKSLKFKVTRFALALHLHLNSLKIMESRVCGFLCILETIRFLYKWFQIPVTESWHILRDSVPPSEPIPAFQLK
jgi:hypothetical protein